MPNEFDKKSEPIIVELKIGFSKNIVNKYVVFKFEHWNDKHPRGILVNTLGNVDNLEAFYEYQLYIRDIHGSISQISKRAHQIFSKISEPENPLAERISLSLRSSTGDIACDL